MFFFILSFFCFDTERSLSKVYFEIENFQLNVQRFAEIFGDITSNLAFFSIKTLLLKSFQFIYLENQDNRDGSEQQKREYEVGTREDGQVELIKAAADATHDAGQRNPGVSWTLEH